MGTQHLNSEQHARRCRGCLSSPRLRQVHELTLAGLERKLFGMTLERLTARLSQDPTLWAVWHLIVQGYHLPDSLIQEAEALCGHKIHWLNDLLKQRTGMPALTFKRLLVRYRMLVGASEMLRGSGTRLFGIAGGCGMSARVFRAECVRVFRAKPGRLKKILRHPEAEPIRELFSSDPVP